MSHFPEDRPRILVVDDEKVIRDMLADFLSMEGYVVRTAEDGTSALGELSKGHYDLAHKAGDKNAELWALSRIAQLDQHDRKVWNLYLDHLLETGNWEEARKVGESALFIDVHNWKTHRSYARALARTGRFVSAVYELNSALICHPKPKDQADIYGELGKAYDKLAEPEMARKAREYQQQIEAAPAPAMGGPEAPGGHPTGHPGGRQKHEDEGT